MHIETQKITAHIPIDLLFEAQKATGLGITETVKIGLQRLAHDRAYEQVLKLKGSHKYSLNLEDIRKDKGEI